MVDNGSRKSLLADKLLLLLFETFLAKEARKRTGCRGKPLDCSKRGISGIAVWTKWQSGPASGNIAAVCLKGNR